MTFIFRNRTIFWDISKWNRGQTKWDGGSIWIAYLFMIHDTLIYKFKYSKTLFHKKKKEKKVVLTNSEPN